MMFNGSDLTAILRVTSVGGRGALTQNIIRTSVPGREGSFRQRREIPEKVLPVSFVVVEAAKADLRNSVDALNLIFNVDSDVPIVFPDEPTVTYYGSLDGQPDWEEILAIGKGTINILCCDPFKYGAEVSVNFSGDQANPSVSGNHKTYPRVEATFTASATEFKVLHTPTNKYVRVIRNFVAGDILVIDFATGKITLNGLVAMPILDWVNSEFFQLGTGTQNVKVTPTSKATTKIFWRPRWRI